MSNRNLSISVIIFLCAIISILSVSCLPEEEFITGSSASINQDLPNFLPDGYYIPFEATGKEFILKDNPISPNLKITSSEEIHITIQAVTNTVSFLIEGVSADVTSTQITISGLVSFFPTADTLYRHKEGYFEEQFQIDNTDTYTYTQNISEKHHIYILPYKGTLNIGTDLVTGPPSPYYNYYPATKTYILKQGIPSPSIGPIVIVANNITLDGANHIISGTGSGYGIYLYNRTNVTIKNCVVKYFAWGICPYYGSGHTIDNNISLNNNIGVEVMMATGITVTSNTANSNIGIGIRLWQSSYNTIIDNVTNGPGQTEGIDVYKSTNNIITGNKASVLSYGIIVYGPFWPAGTVSNNILTNNTVTSVAYGILIQNALAVTLTGNTSALNSRYGIYLYSNYGNIDIYHNNIYGNASNIYSNQAIELSYNQEGNWWGRTVSPGFIAGVDSNASSVVDSYPYLIQDAWTYQPPIPPGVNRPPVLTSPGNQAVNENQLLTFTLSATDPDGDTITYSMVGTPTGATLNSTTGVFNWTPDYTQAGSYTVTFTATADTLTDSKAISITVNNVDRAPVLASPGNQTVNENTNLAFTLLASDLDGDTITYSMAGTTTGVTLIGNAFNWTPTYDQAGVYAVVFTATANALTDSKTISITVNNVDRAPVLTSPNNQSINEGQVLTFTLSATDPDGDVISYSMVGTPTGLTLDTTTGIFSWMPDYTQAGVYPVTFTATSNLLSDSKNITITVNNVEIDITPPTVITATVMPDPAGLGNGTSVLAGALSIKILFSEIMDISYIPTVTYDPTGIIGAQPCTLNGMWSTTTSTNDTYTVFNTNDITVATGDGPATVTITSALDLAGNTSVTGTTTFVININPIRIQNVTSVPPTAFNPQLGETSTIAYVLSEPATTFTFKIANFTTNAVVRTLVDNQPRDAGLNYEIWDGRDDFGAVVSDGKYKIQITATSSAGETAAQPGNPTITVNSALAIFNDISLVPYPFYPGLGQKANVGFNNVNTLTPPISILMSVKDSAGAIITDSGTKYNGQPVGASGNENWDGTNAANFAGGGTAVNDGLYYYEISQVGVPPPQRANPKTGSIVLRRDNTLEASSGPVTVYYNPSTPGLGTINIQTVDPVNLTQEVKAIVTSAPSVYIQSNIYDISATPPVNFTITPALLVFKYDPTITGDVRNTLKLRRWDTTLVPPAWVDVVPQRIDLVNKQIIAEVTSLSLFALFTGADTTPPIITITSPEDGKEYYNLANGQPDIIPISYTAEDPLIENITSGISYTIVTLNGKIYTQDTIDISNLLGENILTITAIDGSGNVARKSVRFSVILPALVRLEPETLKVNPGVLTGFVQFPAGYDVSTIVDVTCDGANSESMELSPDGTTMVIKFRRKAIEEALAQKGEVIDTQFEVRGTFQIGDRVYAFKGIDTIKKILLESVPSK